MVNIDSLHKAGLGQGSGNAELKKMNSLKAREVQKRLKKLADAEHAAVSQRFFKTGPGEYGEGDIFIGIRVPVLRKLAGEYESLPVSQCKILLRSPIHEERLLAILIFIRIYKKCRAPCSDMLLKSSPRIKDSVI